MKYIFSVLLVCALVYLMYMPVEEANPVVVKVQPDPFAKEWADLFKRAEYMTGVGAR